jgi:very-short-patch-repair endonuclease
MAPRPVIPQELTKRPFTLEETRRSGLSRRKLQGTSWRRLSVGVYVWTGLSETPWLRLEAVRSRLPSAAAFSGRTAAWLHGLELTPGDDPIEITLPRASGVSARVGVTVRRSNLKRGEVVTREGVPTTSILRTLFDLGQRLELVEAVVAVDRALQLELVTQAQLDSWMAGRRGSKGIVRFRQIADLAEPGAESPMETRLRLLLMLAGLPRPQTQVRLHDDRGRFLGRVDLFYPASRLAIEYDGGTHRDSLIEDNRRQNALLSAGFRLLRFTSAEVLRAPERVIAQVRAALESHPQPLRKSA